LETDVGEQNDRAAEFPEIVARLQLMAERAREDLGDSITKRQAKNARPPGKLEAAAIR
jgi:arylsulfatase A